MASSACVSLSAFAFLGTENNSGTIARGSREIAPGRGRKARYDQNSRDAIIAVLAEGLRSRQRE